MHRRCSSLSSLVALVVATATLATGCFSNPATGLASTGEPLRLQHRSGTGSYTATEVVGEDKLYDADGNQQGSVQRTRDVRHSYDWHRTAFFQGDEEIDEQDYYRIAGDLSAAASIEHARSRASWTARSGIGLAVLGVTAMMLSFVVTDSQAGRTGTLIVGASVASVGSLLAFRGRKALGITEHFPTGRAEKHAAIIEDCWNGSCAPRQSSTQRPRGLTKEEEAQLRPLYPAGRPGASLRPRVASER